MVSIAGFLGQFMQRRRAEAELVVARDEALEAARAEVRVPGQHEPRDPHADERRDRHDRPAAATRRSTPSSARFAETVRQLRRRAAVDHQRHPRLLEDRGRASSTLDPIDFDVREADRATSCELLAAGARTKRARADRARSPTTCPQRVRGDDGPAAPGADQPRRQRGQVHRATARSSVTRRSSADDAAVLRVDVRDTGIGIDPEQRSTAVRALHARPTARPPAATAAPAWASRSARQLVEMMGGEIGVDERARPGQHVLVHACACPRPSATPPARAARPRGPDGADRRRQRDQPRDPRAAAASWRMRARRAAAARKASRASAPARRGGRAVRPGRCSTTTCPGCDGLERGPRRSAARGRA